MRRPNKRVRLGRVLKHILGVNYVWKIVNLEISPERVTWFFALQDKKDPQKLIHPRIIMYFDKQERVLILNRWGDPMPIAVHADILLTHVEGKPPDLGSS